MKICWGIWRCAKKCPTTNIELEIAHSLLLASAELAEQQRQKLAWFPPALPPFFVSRKRFSSLSTAPTNSSLLVSSLLLFPNPIVPSLLSLVSWFLAAALHTTGGIFYGFYCHVSCTVGVPSTLPLRFDFGSTARTARACGSAARSFSLRLFSPWLLNFVTVVA